MSRGESGEIPYGVQIENSIEYLEVSIGMGSPTRQVRLRLASSRTSTSSSRRLLSMQSIGCADHRKALALRGGAAEPTAAMPATKPAAKAPTNETGPTTADALGAELSSRGQPNKARRPTTANPLVASYLSSGGGEVAPAAAAAMAKQYKGKNPQV